ncbi:MAG: tail fiber domain-containing protein [Gammaproteobacteria bacterium]|nr:tail fiber domain-containing protein [Gammaproteobacteria bacterium]
MAHWTVNLPSGWRELVLLAGTTRVNIAAWTPPAGERPRITGVLEDDADVRYLSRFILDGRQKRVVIHVTAARSGGVGGGRHDLSTTFEEARRVQVAAGGAVWSMPSPNVLDDNAEPYIFHQPAGDPGLERAFDGIVQAAGKLSAGQNVVLTLWDGAGEDPFDTPRPPAAVFDAAASGGVTLDFAGTAAGAVDIPDQTIQLPAAWMRGIRSDFGGGDFVDSLQWYPPIGQRPRIASGFAESGAVYLSDFKIVNDRFGSDEISLFLNFSSTNVDGADQRADLAAAWESAGAATVDAGNHGSATLRPADAPDTADPYSLPANAELEAIYRSIAAAFGDGVRIPSASRTAIGLTLSMAPPATTFEAAASGSVSLDFAGAASATHLPFAETHSASASGSVSLRFSGSATAAKSVTVHTEAAASGSVSLDFAGAASATHLPFAETHSASASGSVSLRFSGSAAAAKHVSIHKDAAAAGSLSLDFSGAAAAGVRKNIVAEAGSYYGDEATGGIWVRHGGTWHLLTELDPSGAATWFFRANAPRASIGADGDNAYKWTSGEWYVKAAGAWSVKEDLTGLAGLGGVDGRGVEYIFASSGDGAAITGAANLPLASQNYDVDALRSAGGLVRGTRKYYDGTPPDLGADRPYMIRFRRAVPGQPAQNDDIGDAPWTQEPSILVYGQDGPLIEFIYLLKDDPNPPARVATSDAQDRMDGYVPAGATDDPDPTTPALRFRFESRRKRGSSADPWGKFSPWKRVSSHANAGPAVYSGHGPPAVGIGLDGDTYVELTGSTGRLSVWLKIAGAWEKASGNPDNAAWSTGSGKPAAAAANGSYYGDSDSGNVWIRHGGAWRWAVDLDPSGDVKWRFGSGVPGNSLGAGGDRYYRWSSGVWYEKAAGRYVARGDLTVGYDPARRNTKPAPVGVRAQVEGTSVTISWRPNPAESYDNQGAPRPLLVFCGGIKIDDDAVAWPGREHIVSPDTTSATIGDLKPNTKYTARICARYDNGGQNINLAAISAYEEVDFTTGTRTVEADAASGNAGTFRNTSGTDTQVNLATNGNIMELRSGSSAARVGRFETDGSFVTSGEVTADDLGVSSDRRLKTDIARIDSALEKLARLRGCTFEKRGRRSAGLIAQDVAEALPEAVTEKDGYLQLSSAAVNGLLVEAVNELAGAVDELRGRLDDGAA